MPTNESLAALAYALRDTYEPGFREGVYRNDKVLNILRGIGFVEGPWPGGSAYKWTINTTANTSVGVFTENQPAPPSVAQGWGQASVSPIYFWGWVTVTGHALDAFRNGGYFNGPDAAMILCQRDIVDIRSTTFLGSTNNGLQQAISATTTYAGITRGSAAYFESSTSSSTFSVANLRTYHASIRAPDKGGNPNANLVSATVMEKYAGLVGTPNTTAAGNHTLRYVAPADGSPPGFDFGYNLSNVGFMGAPVIEVPDLTSTVWLSIDTSAENCKHYIIRNFLVEPHHKEGDNFVFEISTGSTLVIEDPKRDGVYTGI